MLFPFVRAKENLISNFFPQALSLGNRFYRNDVTLPHAAMFGVFGMLAIAVSLFCMRSIQTKQIWEKVQNLIKVGFCGLNVGLALMVIVNLFPSGLLQLYDSIVNGCWHSRHLNFIMSGLFHSLEWVRLGADALFIIVGVLPTVSAIIITYIHGGKRGEEKLIQT